jgi:hypothetical protein
MNECAQLGLGAGWCKTSHLHLEPLLGLLGCVQYCIVMKLHHHLSSLMISFEEYLLSVDWMSHSSRLH